MLYCTCSNRVEILAEALKHALFPLHSDPLEERLVILPSQAMKRYLMMNLVHDFDVAMGLKFPYLDKAVKELSSVSFVARLELGFLIEKEIEERLEAPGLGDLLQEMHITRDNFHEMGPRRALVQLAETLAELFLAYGLYAERLTEECLKGHLDHWQAEIFRSIFQKGDKAFPYKALRKAKKKKVNIHIFCPSFMPKVWLEFFSLFDAKLYTLSSTAHPSFFEHPLLKSCAKGERQFSLFLEEAHVSSARVFQVPSSLMQEDFATEDILVVEEPSTLLRALQADILLQPEKKEWPVDDSIEIHHYQSKFAEVEGLFLRLHSLVESHHIPLQEIVIMAPSITEYTPYIEAVFGHSSSPLSVQFFDTKAAASNLAVQGFLDLLALADSRFDKEAIVKPLYNPKLKAGFSRQECESLMKMMQECGLLWGLDAKDKVLWHKNHYGDASRFTEDASGTWSETFQRIFSIALESGESGFWQQLPLVERWYRFCHQLFEDMRELRGGGQKTLAAWTQFLQQMASSYFEECELLEKLLAQINSSSPALFSFASLYPRLEKILAEEKEAYGDQNRVQAISCCSLLPMRAVPAQVICLLGLSQENFPRRQAPSSLDLRLKREDADFAPTRAEFDRMLFLETLLSAREYLIMSYTKTAEDQEPSLLLSEMREYVGITEKAHGPSHLALITPKDIGVHIRKKEAKLDPTLADLVQVIRHPLKLYYEKSLGIRLKDEKPLLQASLGAYERAVLQRQALSLSEEQMLELLTKKGLIPPKPLGAILEEEVKELFRETQRELRQLSLSPEDFFSRHYIRGLERPFVQGRHRFEKALAIAPGLEVEGHVEALTERGMLFFKEKKFADIAPVWPLSRELLLAKKGERLVLPEMPWGKLLVLYELCLAKPLPLFPKTLESLLEGGGVESSSHDLYFKLYRSSGESADLRDIGPLLHEIYDPLREALCR